jgi:hypothetical protein
VPQEVSVLAAAGWSADFEQLRWQQVINNRPANIFFMIGIICFKAKLIRGAIHTENRKMAEYAHPLSAMLTRTRLVTM